jgi:ArsR family transcriptional regulator
LGNTLEKKRGWADNIFKNMNMKNDSKIKDISNILKVLGSPFRIELLFEIGRGEACVCHLVAVFKKRQAFISQHLMVLRDAGILKTRRDKKYIYYSVSDMDIFSILEKTAGLFGDGQEPAFQIQKLSSASKCNCPKCEN